MAPTTPLRIFAAVTAAGVAAVLVLIQLGGDGRGAQAGPGGPVPTGTQPAPSPTDIGDGPQVLPPAPPPPGQVIYEHDFSSPEGGLLGGASTDSGETPFGDRFAEYTAQGTLLVRATSDRRDFIGGANTGDVVLDGRVLDDMADVSVEVRATPVDTGPGAGWGIACRRDFGVGSFYLGLVSLEGNRRRAAIVRQDVGGEGWTELASSRLPNSILLQVGAPNLLRFDCVGSGLSFSVSGKLVLEARDDALTSGAVTLGANPLPAAGETAVAEVEFDDFVLREVS